MIIREFGIISKIKYKCIDQVFLFNAHNTTLFLCFDFDLPDFSVAIIQYLAEKYGHQSGNPVHQAFYPINDPIERSVVHHRLCFHLSVYQRRVYDYMILPMDYDYQRTDENRIKLTHALAIFDEFLKREQEKSPSTSDGNTADGTGSGTGGLYAAGGSFLSFSFAKYLVGNRDSSLLKLAKTYFSLCFSKD